jgi:hypothetical protein
LTQIKKRKIPMPLRVIKIKIRAMGRAISRPAVAIPIERHRMQMLRPISRKRTLRAEATKQILPKG